LEHRVSDQPGQIPPQQPYAAAPPPPAPPAGYAAGPGPLGKPRGIGVSILLAIVTLGIYTLVWAWKTHDEVKRHSGIGVGGPLGFVIFFLVSPVTYFLLPSEIRQMLERGRRPSRVRGLTGLWILLPLIGNIVWFVKVQGQLNDYWRSLGAAG
jgi:hypothetical protein